MQKAILRRLIALEARMRSLTEPRKSLLPGWLVKAFVEQGGRLDASGNLDFESLRDPPTRGIDHSSEPDIGPPVEV